MLTRSHKISLSLVPSFRFSCECSVHMSAFNCHQLSLFYFKLKTGLSYKSLSAFKTALYRDYRIFCLLCSVVYFC